MAFAARVTMGLLRPDGFWSGGYGFLAALARGLVETGSYGPPAFPAPRPPLYPLLLAGEMALFGRSELAPVVIQALAGTLAVLAVYLLARALGGPGAGLAGASLAAVYPYYVVHDTALQETSVYTVLLASAVLALLAAARDGGLVRSVVAGGLVGLATLCRDSTLVFAALAGGWLRWSAGREGRRPALAYALAVTLVVAPWAIRNTAIYGVPVLTAGPWGPGFMLWVGHNPFTLVGYPRRSIDRSTERALAALTADDRASLAAATRRGDLARDRWFARRALAFIRADPARALRAAAVKLGAGLGPVLSPTDGSWPRHLFYTSTYVPVVALAAVGARRAMRGRRERPALVLLGLLGVTFALVSTLFHAHTSHRAHLDLYLLALAGIALTPSGSIGGDGPPA